MSIAELERLPPPVLGLPPAAERSRLEVVRDARAADGLTWLRPTFRPCDDVRFLPVRRSASAFDADASPTTWLLAEGLNGLDPALQHVLVSRLSHHSDRLHPLVADEGCDVRIGVASVSGALRVALLAWLPPSHTELSVIEQGLFHDAPAHALTLLVRPPTVWSLGEAVDAARRVPGGPRFEPERFEKLELHGRARVRRGHLRRLRAAVARIERQLPVTGFPVASATVADGSAVIAADDASCRAVAARGLARFAMSTVVRRATC